MTKELDVTDPITGPIHRELRSAAAYLPLAS